MRYFPIKCFKFETRYPDSATKIQLGKGWTFTAEPNAPDQRVFILTFTGMKYYTDPDSNLDYTTNSDSNNLNVLEQFYQQVKTWDTFKLAHPAYGDVVCQFNKPLDVPKGITNGLGMVEDFTIELLEIPG